MLCIEVPATTATPEVTALFRDPSRLAAWLGELPGRTTGERAVRLLDWLTLAAGAHLEPRCRLNGLGVIEPYVLPVIDGLRRATQTAAVPLPPEKLRVLELALALSQQLALHYCIVARQLADLQAQADHQARKMLATALGRGMHFTAQALADRYAHYQPIPAGLWLQANQIYDFSETIGVMPPPEARETEVAFHYKRIVAVALACPARLMPGDAETAHALTADWTDVIHIAQPGTRQPGGRCLVDLAADAPPRRLRADADQPAAREPRIVEIDGLLDRLRETLRESLLSATRGGHRTLDMAVRSRRDRLLRLLQAWESRPERRHAREPAQGRTSVVFGLARIHALVDPDPQPARLAPHKSAEALADEADPWRCRHEPLSDNPDAHTFERVNVSDGGLALRLRPGARLRLSGEDGSEPLPCCKVGDLVAWRTEDDTTGGWQLASVRWLQLDADGNITLGIMKLGALFEAIRARPVGGPASSGAEVPVLVLRHSPQEPAGQILAPSAVFDVGTILEVERPQRLARLHLTRQIEASGCYSRFASHLV